MSIRSNQTANCPACKQPVQTLDTECPHCGVNLDMAAASASRSIASSLKSPPEMPLSPEVLVPRLGDTLVERGLINTDQLEKALAYQKERSAAGESVLLGKALVDLGMIDKLSLERAVTEQVFQLHNALERSNKLLEERVIERTAELSDALRRLTELNERKNNFVSNISHELRTPLAHIIGYVELLSDGSLGSVSDSQKNALGVIRKAYHRLHELIDNLIQFSLLSQSEVTLNIEEVSVNELLHAAAARYQNQAQEHRIELSTNLLEEDARLRADKEKLRWVLEQLIDNAIKFNNPQGKVAVSAEKNSHSVILSVMDNGIGIEVDKIDEVFEPFHQLDGSSTRRYGGTGLGLALARRILQGHNTQFLIESQPGKGTRFSFHLPVIE